LVFFGVYSPYSADAVSGIAMDMMESLISFMVFLIAAAIISAFELSYLRTNLDDKTRRYLAHATKLTLYSSILLLIQISIVALVAADTRMTLVMVMASLPIMLALVTVRLLGRYSGTGQAPPGLSKLPGRQVQDLSPGPLVHQGS